MCVRLKLQYQPTELNKFVVENSPELQREYHPTPYLLNGNLQTICYAVKRHFINCKFGIEYNRVLLKLKDGGQLAMDWPVFPEVDKNLKPDTPIIALLAGLTGGRKDIYIANMMKEAAKIGYKTVLVNQRGCSNTPLLTPKFYCGASIGDAHEVFLRIKQEYPTNPLYAVGMSLGSNILVNYMGAHKENCLLKGMVGVCNPFDFYSLDQHLASYLFGVYHKALGKHMVKLLSEHLDACRPLEKKMGYTLEDGMSRVKTSRDFDNTFTSYMFDYHTAYNYYRKASSALSIDDVCTPSLFINMLDDPVVTKHIIPYRECLVNKNIILATHPCGGHLGLFTGWRPRQWITEPALGFIKSLEKWYSKK